MEPSASSETVHGQRIPPVLAGRPDLVAPRVGLPSFTRAELRELVFRGENDSEVCERVLAQAARVAGAIELAIGEGLAELQRGDRLMQLGFSRLKDYAGNILGISDRKAQAAAQLARELASRPVLAAATRAGLVTPRKALTVLRVARGDAEAAWVELARELTVRELEEAVRAELRRRGLPGGDAAEELRAELEEPRVPLRVGLLREQDRADIRKAFEVAEALLPGSQRWEQLEAIAQEYNGGHPLDAEGEQQAEALARMRAGVRGVRPGREPSARVRARLEEETERWCFLDAPRPVEAPDVGWAATPEELDVQLCALAQESLAWDDLVGYCARVVKESGLVRMAGFESFEHYARERLGLSPRTVEQRAALEGRLARVPALRAAKDAGLPYSKLLILSGLPDGEIAALAARAPKLTVVELREAVEEKTFAVALAQPAGAAAEPPGGAAEPPGGAADPAGDVAAAAGATPQMCAAGPLQVWLPRSIVLVVQLAFEAARRYEGYTWYDGECLGRLARHFLDVWADVVPRPRTIAQKVRARDRRCVVPGCSLASAQAHHVETRAQGGETSMENELGGCIPHHQIGIHRGYLTVTGTAPDHLTWSVGGKVWKDAKFGRD